MPSTPDSVERLPARSSVRSADGAALDVIEVADQLDALDLDSATEHELSVLIYVCEDRARRARALLHR